MKKILITGLTGFVGSWLSLLLFSNNYKVYGVSLKNTNSFHIYNKARISKFCKSYICDIKDYNKLHKIFNEVKPDIVIHLTAQPIVFESYYKPFDTFYTNILGTLNVLELSNKLSSGRVINFTSDKVYQNKNKNISFKENDTLKGNDPYSLSKSCSDMIGQCLNVHNKHNINKLKISTIRCGNIIGGGDWSRYRLIPDYYSSYLSKKTLFIRQPLNTRPWQHVINPIYIIYQMIGKKNPKFFDEFNIGPKNYNYNVRYVLNELNKLNKNKKVKIKYKNLYSLKESKFLRLNDSKSRKIFQYPKSNFKKDLLKTNEWYLSSFNNTNMTDFTLQQIHEYI